MSERIEREKVMEAFNHQLWEDGDTLDLLSKVFDYTESLEVDRDDYQALCKRTKAILDDENFWDKTSSDNGWYGSLHKDLEKASKHKYKDIMFKKAMEVIGTLEGDKLKLEADKTRLEEELATYRDGVIAIYPNETTVEAEDGSLWINIPFEYDYGTYKVLIQEIKNDTHSKV